MTQGTKGDTLVRDFAQTIIALIDRVGTDEARLNSGLIEAARPVLKRPDLLSLPGPMRPGNHIDWSRYLYYDGGLYVTIDQLPMGLTVQPHDHGTHEGFIMYRGRVKHTQYRRKDDRSKPGFADLEVAGERELAFGDAVTLVPPHDIHGFSVLTEDTYCITWVAGHYKTDRAYFQPEAKTYKLRQPKGVAA